MEDTIDYIKQFLLYGNEEAAEWIGYTRNEEDWNEYKLVIIPGDNILTGERKEWTVPDYTKPPKARKLGEIIDEFGDKTGGTWIIDDDLIYNTLFLLSQAELTMDLPRDQHGRLASKDSVLGSQGMTTIPVLDEYSRLVTKLLEQALPEQHFSSVILTHDVDFLEQYRHLRGFLGAAKRGHLNDAIQALQNIENDPAFTFHWLHAQDQRVGGAKEIYFLKAAHGKGFDYPQYKLGGADFNTLVSLLTEENAAIGLHSSYFATENKAYKEQKQHLESVLPKRVTSHRSHYLRINAVADLLALADAGITDDYTLGWADHIGFRFGTTRAARFINPSTLELTNLTLHPLAIMDCTLSNDNYMNLSEEEAYYAAQQLIDKVRQHGGELVLLWHNHIFTPDTYHKQLYQEIIDYICE